MNALLPLLAHALSAPAHAAGLDLLEVGGAYGTPAATNPSAIWWNPAGLAVGGGTQFLIEGAPVFGGVTAQRDNPSYGDLNPELFAKGYPDSYDYSGTDRLSSTGVVPFLGLSSNFLVPGLGVGIGLAVPTARGGVSDQQWGSNRFYIREGDIRAIHAMAGAGYQILNKVAFGASVSFVDSSYYANTDTTTYPDLYKQASALLPNTPEFQDGYLEQQDYTATVVLGGEDGDGHGYLKDQAITFGAGVYVTPLGNKLGISLSYNHGMKLEHTGPLTMKFQCPPQYDDFVSAAVRFGAEQNGICDTTVQGTGGSAYRLPGRINLGVVVSPIDRLRLEAMGSYVMWSVFQDYDITTNVKADEFLDKAASPDKAEESAELLSQKRPFARDAKNTFWVGVDGKVRLNSMFSAGARAIYDHHAVPLASVSANNADFDAVILGAMTQFNPIDQLGVSLSFSHQFLAARTVTDSAFGVTLDPEAQKPARYFYPTANGQYSGGINRLGVAVHGKFGGNTQW